MFKIHYTVVNMDKSVVILTTQDGDWEGLFIDNKLISEGHVLGEGKSKTYLLKQSEIFNFKYNDVICHVLKNEDDEILSNNGNFPKLLSDLKGIYNI